VDRVFLDTESPIEIHDPTLKRIVRIEKSGSQSTVIWNPWVTKSQQIPDFGTDEFRRMLCVETGNVDRNRITLPPGETAVLKTIVSSRPA
jgi:D-hexose-6-phosphate mutarotase